MRRCPKNRGDSLWPRPIQKAIKKCKFLGDFMCQRRYGHEPRDEETYEGGGDRVRKLWPKIGVQ